MFPSIARIFNARLLASGAATASAQGPALASDNLSTFKGAKKVVIDHFGVEFITTLKARDMAAARAQTSRPMATRCRKPPRRKAGPATASPRPCRSA